MKNVLLTFMLLLTFALPAHAAEKETAYDRVMRTNTLRCGYVHWEPAFNIDPNTKVFSGVFHDLTEEIGKRLSLKIDWVEETAWATAIDGMTSGRYDAVCSNFFPTPARARVVDFSQPASFSPVYIWVRPDSPLLVKAKDSIDLLDTPEVTFVSIDGSAVAQVTERRFTKATKTAYPESTPFPDMLDGLAKGKGDAALVEAATVGKYLKRNPGKLVRLYDKPYAAFPNALLLPMGDVRLKSMLDTAIRDILYDGTFRQILVTYGVQDDYLPVPTF